MVDNRTGTGENLVMTLGAVCRDDIALVGGKGANLGELTRAGFPVPRGFVVTTHAYDLAIDQDVLRQRLAVLTGIDRDDAPAVGRVSRSIQEIFTAMVVPGAVADAVLAAYHSLGPEPVAVRSSATSEDLPEAAFAGQQETYLNIIGETALLEALRRCWGSLWSERAIVYRAHRDVQQTVVKLAVVVQRLVSADVAGVVFTAHPVTGRRDEIVVDASPGLGEAVVSGIVTPDHVVLDKRTLAIKEQQVGAREVVIRPLPNGGTEQETQGLPHVNAEACLPESVIIELAGLAVAVERHFGAPQDMEWAWAEGKLHVLQTRPMTAPPEPVAWEPPTAGYWLRNLRLGEWLPEPMTPLFQDWLLERIEEGYLSGMRKTIGTALPWMYAAINGWYYVAAPHITPGTILRAAVESRGRIFPFALNALIRVGNKPEVADRNVLRALAEEWRQELLPRYRAQVAEGERCFDGVRTEGLIALIDQIGSLAGEYLWSLAIVGGSAWKMEGCLARFVRRHVSAGAGSNTPLMLRGLPGTDLDVPAHAVQSVDWYWPTAGERGWAHGQTVGADRRQRLAVERESTEAACREALDHSPVLRAGFDTLLAVAQRYAALREAQAREFTLGWPLIRRCALRLGTALCSEGKIDKEEDVFFLTRMDLQSPADLHETVRRRRTTWERQRRLVAPLTIGKPPRLMEAALTGTVEAVRAKGRIPDGAVSGQPASPGRATGRARVVRGPEDFRQFQSGEVLVARATTPAWTPLFARAAAVVTDGGTLAAHASLVAREYGIPAVVATGNATDRLRNGQVLTVDGSAGVVEIIES